MSRDKRDKNLFIVDGYSYVFQQFYGMRNLTTPTGVPSNAVFGMAQMLLKVLGEEKPDAMVCVFDTKEPTFRHEMYPEYKANRSEMPDDLSVQLPYLWRLLDGFRVSKVTKPGYEADDLIATYAKIAVSEGWHVDVITRDKDIKQILNENISFYDPADGRRTGIKEFEEEFGFPPARFVDFLALAGDTADNIPGVPGCGKKTALKYIQEYGSLDGLLDHKDEIKGKAGEKLRDNVDKAHLAYRLASLDYDVPLDVPLNDLKVREWNRDALKDLFVEMNFNRFIMKLGLTGGAASVEAPAKEEPKPAAKEAKAKQKSLFPDSGTGILPVNSTDGTSVPRGEGGTLETYQTIGSKYHLVTDVSELKKLAAKLSKAKEISIDTETTGVDPMEADLVGISFAIEPGEGWYIAHRGPEGEVIPLETLHEHLKPIIENEQIPKIGHNIKYDALILMRHGFEFRGYGFDTMVAAFLIDSERGGIGLDAQAIRWLRRENIHIESLIGSGRKQTTIDTAPLVDVANYAAEDTDVALQLKLVLEKEIERLGHNDLFFKCEMPLVEVLAHIEYFGLKIDEKMLNKLSDELNKRAGQLEKEIYILAGEEFTIGSPKQLGAILFEKMGLPPTKKTKTGWSTDAETLETLAQHHELPAKIIEYRQVTKLSSTYTEALPAAINRRTGMVHTSLNQTVAATGRLSSNRPNLQNIPIRSEIGRSVREAFIPSSEDKLLLTADYSQVELRVLAHFCKDKALVQAFRDGADLHARVASEIFGVAEKEVTISQRAVAKAINFGLIYGQGPFGLSRVANISFSDAKNFIDRYFALFSSVKSYVEEVADLAKERGYVETILGRRRYLSDINSPIKQRELGARRVAVNSVIQGSAADLIKVAMVNLFKRIRDEKLDLRMLLQIHDELLCELPIGTEEKYKRIVKETMEGAMTLDVPLVANADVGKCWKELK
ncbi:MAG: DNA polymerase I [Planctomycetes bacterium]|nr:DNA polymerase I [Planctomycetota bacterium]